VALGHRVAVGRVSTGDTLVRVTPRARPVVLVATAVASLVLVGGGILVGRLVGWSWASSIFLGVVAYVLAIQAAWVIAGAVAVNRELRMWRGSHDWAQERRIP
jgi:hypothetical protein